MEKLENLVNQIAKYSTDLNLIIFITSQLFIFLKSKNALVVAGTSAIAAVIIFICSTLCFVSLKREDPSFNLARKILSKIIFPVGMSLIWFVLYYF